MKKIIVFIIAIMAIAGVLFIAKNFNGEDNDIKTNDNEVNVNNKEDELPEETLNIKYGDVSEDGEITSADTVLLKQYLETGKKLTSQAIKNADINGDNNVNNVDLVLLTGVLTGFYEHNLTMPLTNYILYGDVSEDGEISSADSVLLKKHLDVSEELTDQALKNADINADGEINSTDATLLNEFLVDMHSNTLPYEPIK